jgi:branched-chain amino acid aminotransferase
MRSIVWVNGRATPPEEAVVPALDRGFLYGDSVYEVIWWHRGRPIQAAEHLARLVESGRRVYLDVPGSAAHWLGILSEAVAASGASADEDAYVRLVVTRGSGPLGLHVAKELVPNVVVIVAPANRPAPAQWERGLSVALVGRRRVSAKALDPGAKTGNYMNNLLALHEAEAVGADDAVLLNDAGDVTEGTTANVYVVRGGRVATPPLDAGILKGTTRTRVLSLCGRAGIVAEEARLSPDDLLRADEVFLSSSVRGVIGVTRIDGRAVGSGHPGPVTAKVHRMFEDAADDEAAGAGAGAERSGAGPASPPRR